jgi:hypothetical protein
MAGGYLRPAPPWSYLRYPAIGILHFQRIVPPAADLQQLFREKGITRVVVADDVARGWAAPLAWLGTPRRIGGVEVYPGCAESSRSSSS